MTNVFWNEKSQNFTHDGNAHADEVLVAAILIAARPDLDFSESIEIKSMHSTFNDNGKCEISGKRCYTEKEAGQVLNKKHHKSGGAKTIPKRKYFCHECGCWHLTHFATCKRERANHQMLVNVLENEERNNWREDSVELLSYRLNHW